MTILSLKEVSLAYGHQALLAAVDLQIQPGERICLVGRNGAGKSTLLRVISGLIVPDDGEVWRRDTLRISHLEQEVPADAAGTVYELVSEGLGELGRLLVEYHRAAQGLEGGDDPLEHLAKLQHRIEARDGWNTNQKVDTVLSRLALPADRLLAHCSGGVRRRVMLARALVSEPDLLLLDEPTNHMDIAAITWLEEFLLAYRGALVFITHDRTFLAHLATRIVELDRGRLTSFPGDYEHYLRKKDELLEIEARADARFDKRLADQEAWLRQGIKARRTRNQGRVRKLMAMRRERSQRVATQGRASMEVDTGELSGRQVIDLRHVNFGYDGQPVIHDFSTRIMRGDRVGIVGPNGSGKSTLLRLLLGELAPDSGRIVRGTRLQVAYFDQQRDQLNPELTVRENISEGRDHVSIRGRSRHVISYLKDFLFPPQRVDTPVRVLSGGERNRLLLARLFTRPANMMVLDEPTNDLDVDTLELLEDLLTEYDGTLLVVSHDRTFLDNVVTSTLVFEGDGRIGEYVGGYEDYLRQRTAAPPGPPPPPPTGAPSRTPRHKRRSTKLGYREKLELEALPDRIEALEAEQQQLEHRINSGDFYQQDKPAITATLERLEEVHQELQRAYERWETLDARDR